jgi:predicted AAA+ superfamily ATPase
MALDRLGYINKIQSRLLEYPIVSPSGSRQAGTNTLTLLLAKTLGRREVHHFDIESPGDLAFLSNPELVLSPLRSLVILDEIQHPAELYAVLRVFADLPDLSARFVILVSASLR